MKNMVAVLFLFFSCVSFAAGQDQAEDACVDIEINEHIRLVLDVEAALAASGADMAQCVAMDLHAPPTGACKLFGNQVLIAKNAVGYGLAVRGVDGTVRAFWARWSDIEVTATILAPTNADRHDIAAQEEVLVFVRGLLVPQPTELAKSN